MTPHLHKFTRLRAWFSKASAKNIPQTKLDTLPTSVAEGPSLPVGPVLFAPSLRATSKECTLALPSATKPVKRSKRKATKQAIKRAFTKLRSKLHRKKLDEALVPREIPSSSGFVFVSGSNYEQGNVLELSKNGLIGVCDTTEYSEPIICSRFRTTMQCAQMKSSTSTVCATAVVAPLERAKALLQSVTTVGFPSMYHSFKQSMKIACETNNQVTENGSVTLSSNKVSSLKDPSVIVSAELDVDTMDTGIQVSTETKRARVRGKKKRRGRGKKGKKSSPEGAVDEQSLDVQDNVQIVLVEISSD